MTPEAFIYATLAPLVANRVYPVAFPQPPRAPVWPSIRYSLIDASPVADICGDGDEETDEVRYQVDIVSHYEAGYAAHRALVRQVRAAMATFPIPASIESVGEDPLDPETLTYRSRIDYILHGSTTT